MSGKHTGGDWYASKGSMGQGLIIEEETGRNVAVAYEEKDAALLAAGPALLAFAQACMEYWQDGGMPLSPSAMLTPDDRTILETARSALARATGEGA